MAQHPKLVDLPIAAKDQFEIFFWHLRAIFLALFLIVKLPKSEPSKDRCCLCHCRLNANSTHAHRYSKDNDASWRQEWPQNSEKQSSSISYCSMARITWRRGCHVCRSLSLVCHLQHTSRKSRITLLEQHLTLLDPPSRYYPLKTWTKCRHWFHQFRRIRHGFQLDSCTQGKRRDHFHQVKMFRLIDKQAGRR